MIHFIHISATVKKQEQLLRKSAKKGKLVLRQYKVILNELQQGDFSALSLFSKRTKHGEQRVTNCIKYDLGGGYRLITIKNGYGLFITFLGNHDEVDDWLEKNKGYSPDRNSSEFAKSCTLSIVTQPKASHSKRPSLDSECDDYETQLHSKIDESTLKAIFCGLFTSNKNQRIQDINLKKPLE